MHYVDVHTHLTHERFKADLDLVIQRAVDAGLGAVVVNGLEPNSNREILQLAQDHPVIKPALGIYPIEAINDILPEDFAHPIAKFSVDDEIEFIREQAEKKNIMAVGECGLDGYWVGSETFARQEQVFEQLIEIAKNNDIPIIVHSRKLEKRTGEILAHHKVEKADFHCFCGRTKLAKQLAETHGWHFSIPANVLKNEAFQKMLKILPTESILTETDAPYLAPIRGERNEPANVVTTVAAFADIRSIEIDEAKNIIWQNYCRLFAIASTEC